MEPKTKKVFFVNHLSRSTTWKDPRPLPVLGKPNRSGSAIHGSSNVIKSQSVYQQQTQQQAQRSHSTFPAARNNGFGPPATAPSTSTYSVSSNPPATAPSAPAASNASSSNDAVGDVAMVTGFGKVWET